MADRQEGESARRRLRGRNIAVLIALAAFVALIYMVTVARLQTGLEATMEAERLEAEAASQGVSTNDGTDGGARDGGAIPTDPTAIQGEAQ